MRPLSAAQKAAALQTVCVKPVVLPLQPSLLRAIFSVDPDEVRSLILKKEDVNVQVSLSAPECPL